MLIRLKRGLRIRLSGMPNLAPLNLEAGIEPAVSSIGLSGLDYPEVRPEFMVEPGQTVTAGQALVRDRRRPEIVLTSPVAGTVSAIVPRDTETAAFFIGLEAINAEPPRFAVPQNWRCDAAVRRSLLASGLWACLQERPFGRLPDPDARPDAILISAMAADELAPEPTPLIAARQADWATGIDALAQLTDGPVRACQAPGPALAADSAAFSGVYPAGLPGTHVHHLYPVGNGRRVWTLNYQEVIAIGCLFNAGRIVMHRTIALSGPGVSAPCLLRAPIGARIDELTGGRLRHGPHRIVSGPFLSGREAQHLGRTHLQVCVLPSGHVLERRKLWSRRQTAGPIIPVAAHEKTFPFDLPVVPLLRALAVGDSESARELGCLELIEEDVAVLSYVCPSHNDYAPMLRAVLDELRRDR